MAICAALALGAYDDYREAVAGWSGCDIFQPNEANHALYRRMNEYTWHITASPMKSEKAHPILAKQEEGVRMSLTKAEIR